MLDISALHSPEARESQHLAYHLTAMYAQMIEDANFLRSFGKHWILRLGHACGLVEVSGEVMFAFDEDGVIVGANTGARRRFGDSRVGHSSAKATVWQIDPQKCVRCGNCATAGGLEQSAVKCVHAYAICGYCQLCTGYFEHEPNELNTGAENCLCTTSAIKRTYVEDPYYEYSIEEELCIGCAKCVEGCTRFGNGSLFLQVRHDRCVNCNECAISKVCAGDAFRRVPADEPYLLKTHH